ncbi:MAG TPA: acyl carrier protein [Noviherbaspirillum sp.]|nr:acyl carrier protein [Noviherbaspirillum sp.]
MSTYERLIGILASEYKLKPEQLQPEARLDQIGIDSLGAMELLFKIEDEFGIQVPSDQVQLATVGEVAAYIESLVAQQAPVATPQQAQQPQQARP